MSAAEGNNTSEFHIPLELRLARGTECTPGFIVLRVMFVHLLILSAAHQNQVVGQSPFVDRRNKRGWRSSSSGNSSEQRAGRLKPKIIKQMLI